MEMTQNINYGQWLISTYNKKSVSQVKEEKEIKELSEEEKFAEFKKEIWNEINSWPRDSRVNESIQITDAAFKRMMTDEDFKNQMMKRMKEDADVGRPPIVYGITWIDENGYRGIAYNDYDMGKAAFDVHSKDKDTFYVKNASPRQDYMELWEERRYRREVWREKLDKVYEEQLYMKQCWERKEIKELSVEEKLAEFKKEIWNEIDSMPWGCDISIYITDDAFKKMMDDTDFKDSMLNKIREDASVSGIKGGGTILNITESGYSGFSWMEGYAKEGSAGVKAHSQGSFYYKVTNHKQDYMELWEKRRHKREVQREKLDKAYVEQLYLDRYCTRKEKIAAAYEASILENSIQE